MKMYSTATRKPMMCGGDSRKKMQTGGRAVSDADKKAMASAAANADTQSRIATGQATKKDKMLEQKQTLEQMMRKKVPELQSIAGDDSESAMRRQMAKRALTEKGGSAGAAAFPSGDQEPAGNRYGGKAKK